MHEGILTLTQSKSEIESLQGQLRAERELRQVAEQYLSPQNVCLLRSCRLDLTPHSL